MVSVRFAYGFLNKLRLHSIFVQTMPLGSTGLLDLLHCYYGLLPHGFTGHFLPVRGVRFLHIALRRPPVVPLFPAFSSYFQL